MKYLITGGAGFIGSHLADTLVTRGDEVILLDDLTTGSPGNVAHLIPRDDVAFHNGRVQDAELVADLVRQADVVVHLAASVGVDVILRDPLTAMANNIRGTEVVLEACREYGRKVLLTSTSEIYGKNASGPVAEDADRILGPTTTARWSYSTSKAVDEILAFGFWRMHGTPTIVVRLFNTSGPRQTGSYGMVLPRFVDQALRDDPLTVYGDGEQQRCFCHVLDTVRALIAVLDNPHCVGEVFNVGTQQETTINDLARLVIRMTGSTSEIVHIPYKVAYDEGFEDMFRRIPDTNKIKEFTGWTPTRSLPTIVADLLSERSEMTRH